MKQLTLIVLLCLLATPVLQADEFRFHHENVLGTSGELIVVASSSSTADRAESEILRAIDRLSGILSTYDSRSEIRRWQAGELGAEVSSDLYAVLRLCDEFSQVSGGAFNPRVAAVTELWKQAAKDKLEPESRQLQETVEAIQQSAWALEPDRRSAHWLGGRSPISVDAIAKGYIIDRAVEAAMDVPGVIAVMVNIGGDLRVAGNLDQLITIASPADPLAKLESISVRGKAVATSGGYHRYFEVAGRRYSHIIDPRTGRPVEHSASVTVLAATGAAADAMATSLSVMPVQEALLWCDKHPKFECLIVDSQGQSHRSEGWPGERFVDVPVGVAEQTRQEQDEKSWLEGAKLTVEFEFNRPDSRRYRRPYVAVWVENEEGFPVRTLALWLLEGKGSRWHRDLRRWYKQERVRQDAEEGRLIGTISEATRPPGKYKLVWDGKDNQGKLVTQGTYTLYIESAREHGPYEISKATIVIGSENQQGEIEGKEDLKSATYEYKK